MKNNLLKALSSTVFAFILFYPSFLHAQKAKQSNDDENLPKQLTKIIIKDGWAIPLVEKTKLVNEGSVTIQNQSVKIKAYKPQETMNLKANYFALLEDDTLVQAEKIFEIVSIASYNLNENTFAYRINANEIETGKDNKQTVTDNAFTIFYIDEDGDGKFEAMYLNQYELPKFPDWIKLRKKEIKK